MTSWREQGRRWVTFIATVLPLLLPLYVIRLRIGPLPTTALEIVLLAWLGGFTLVGGGFAWRSAWQEVSKKRWPVLLGAWIVIGGIEALLAPHVLSGLGLWRAYILEPVLVFIALHAVIAEQRQVERLRRACFLVVIPLVVWAMTQFITGKGIPHPWDVSIAAGRRATGPYPFPNALALFLAPITAYAVAWWGVRPRDLFAGITVLLGVLGILLARSDGAALAILVVSVLVFFGRPKGRWFVAAATMGAALLFFILPSLRFKIWQVLTFQEWSGRVRVWMWQETWQMLRAHWLTGAGMGGYPQVVAPFHQKKFIEIFQYPHTLILNVWSEMGLLGLGVFGAFIAKWVKTAIPVWRAYGYQYSLLILAPLLALLIQGLVDVPYFKNDLALQFWLLLFLAEASFHTVAVDEPKNA